MQWYWKFALVIAVTTVITVALSVWETRRVSQSHFVLQPLIYSAGFYLDLPLSCKDFYLLS